MDTKKVLRVIKQHVWGPTGSVILHILAILALIRLVTYSSVEKAPEVEVVIMEPDATELEEFEKELEQLEQPELVDAITPPEVDMSVDQPPEVDDFTAPEPDMDMAALDVVSDINSPLVMKGLFQGRSSGGRAGSLRSYAGKWGEHTERAVIKALRWLKEHQKPDGSWGARSHEDAVGYTGLALLTFLAHGETTASEEYGPTVEKAIRWLVDQQHETGFFGPIPEGLPGAKKPFGNYIHSVYAHAIATYALSEAYGLTRIPMLKEPMEKGAKVILDGQQKGGGWDYRYAKGSRRDTSVSGWQIQALKAAYIAGAEDPRVRPALTNAASDLVSIQDGDSGTFGYSSPADRVPPPKRGITGVGVLCLQLIGYANTQPVKRGLNALDNMSCDWEDAIEAPMYGWYYVTQAKFHKGGSEWTGWNNKIAPTLVKNQNEDGSWGVPKTKVPHGEGDSKVYTTTLAALTLQVYYRFLPTYKPIEVIDDDIGGSDDIEIEVL